MSNNRLERVAKIAASYPTKEEFFFTSDNTLFVDKGNANLHAKTLKNTEIETVTKAEALAGENAGDNTGKSVDLKTFAEELAAKTVAELKELAADIEGLKLSGKETKKQLVDLIIEAADKAAATAGSTQ